MPEDTEIFMDSYRVNERAWAAVLRRLHELRGEGESMASLGRLLKVGRATIKQWLDYGMGGDRITFRNMVHYLDRLQIPLEQVYGVDIDVPEEPIAPEPEAPTQYEKHIAAILRDGSQLMGKKVDVIARQVLGDEHDSIAMHEILDGKRTMTVAQFINTCNAIGIAPDKVIERANELSKDDQESTVRRTA
jgi:hypothetical protein